MVQLIMSDSSLVSNRKRTYAKDHLATLPGHDTLRSYTAHISLNFLCLTPTAPTAPWYELKNYKTELVIHFLNFPVGARRIFVPFVRRKYGADPYTVGIRFAPEEAVIQGSSHVNSQSAYHLTVCGSVSKSLQRRTACVLNPNIPIRSMTLKFLDGFTGNPATIGSTNTIAVTAIVETVSNMSDC